MSDDAQAEIALTPTQELIMEVLASRYREGDQLWTFSSRLRRQLEAVASHGLIDVMHGIVEKTVRASLTDEGKAAWLSDAYSKPTTRTINVTTTVDTDEIKAVLWHVSNNPGCGLPRDPYVDNWLLLLSRAVARNDEETVSKIVAAMPTGLAWAYFRSREDDGVAALRELLASNPD